MITRSVPLVNAAVLFMNRRGQLCNALDEMARMLTKTSGDVYKSGLDETAIHHLNTRLFLQVHVTNVIEASQDYDQAVAAYLAAKETERKNQVLVDSGVLPTTKQ